MSLVARGFYVGISTKTFYQHMTGPALWLAPIQADLEIDEGDRSDKDTAGCST